MPISRRSGPAAAALIMAAALATGSALGAEPLALENLLSGILHVKTVINPDGRTVENLGHERDGTGVVIDDKGLILTIGYLMVEAQGAEVTTNDGHTVRPRSSAMTRKPASDCCGRSRRSRRTPWRSANRPRSRWRTANWR